MQNWFEHGNAAGEILNKTSILEDLLDITQLPLVPQKALYNFLHHAAVLSKTCKQSLMCNISGV